MLIVIPYSSTGAGTGGSNQITRWCLSLCNPCLHDFYIIPCYIVFCKKNSKISNSIAAFLSLPLWGFYIKYISTGNPIIFVIFDIKIRNKKFIKIRNWQVENYFFNSSWESICWNYAAYAENKQIPTCVRVPQHWLNESADSIFPDSGELRVWPIY